MPAESRLAVRQSVRWLLLLLQAVSIETNISIIATRNRFISLGFGIKLFFNKYLDASIAGEFDSPHGKSV